MFGDTAALFIQTINVIKNNRQKVILPLLNKPIPVIADTYVDPEFGTGVVKITPALI